MISLPEERLYTFSEYFTCNFINGYNLLNTPTNNSEVLSWELVAVLVELHMSSFYYQLLSFTSSYNGVYCDKFSYQ